MSSTKRKIEGSAKEAAGRVEQAVGKVVGSERMVAKGRAHELEGKGRKEVAKAEERVKGKAQELGGKLEQKLGKAVDSKEMQLRGKAQQLEGKAKQRSNERS